MGSNAVGEQKIIELSGMNMEEKLGGEMLPSLFYTFQYASPFSEQEGALVFKDVLPLIMCVWNEGDKVGGINFNMLPNNVRAMLLDIIYGTNPTFYDNDVYNGSMINEPFANALVNPESRKNVLLAMSDKTGVNIGSALRVYSKQFIANMRYIEYDMWKYIPFLNYTEGVRGASLADIQKSLLAKLRK